MFIFELLHNCGIILEVETLRQNVSTRVLDLYKIIFILTSATPFLKIDLTKTMLLAITVKARDLDVSSRKAIANTKNQLRKVMKRLTASVLILLLASCGKSPEQARKDLFAMGLQFDQRTFYQVAYKCDLLPINDFLIGGIEPGSGLMGASEGGCVPIVKKLIGKTKETYYLANALYLAVDKQPQPQYTEIVQILLNAGADPNIRIENKQPYLTVASEQNNVEVVKLLLNKGANPQDIDGINSSALVIAAYNSEEITRILLEKDANPNSLGCSNLSCTALSEAVRSGNEATVKLLLDKGAAVKDGQDGQSLALEQAVYTHNPNLIKLLVKAGADPNQRSANSASLLVQMVNQSEINLPTIEALLEAGAKPNEEDGNSVALLNAVKYRQNPEAVKLLLKHGANANTISSSFFKVPRTILDEAPDDMAEILKQYGAVSGEKLNEKK
jgi:ankyrin repeat protein